MIRMKTGFFTCVFILIISPALWSQTAPITSTGRITNAIPGDPAVPVAITVINFTEIAQFTLTMKFDTTRIRYVSSTVHGSLTGMTVSYLHPSGNTQGKIILSWSGASNISLADGSAIAELVFHYKSGTGNLTWAYTFGSVCQYKRWSGSTLISLADSPKTSFYQNGGISNRGAPVVHAPVYSSPVPGSLPVEITTNSFTNISAFTLYLEYDPQVITYSNIYVKNPIFDASFQVGDNQGPGGKRWIIMQWFGLPVNLAEGSIICTLHFSYPSENCLASQLFWYDNGPSCQYSDSNGDVLLDTPRNSYYHGGSVAATLPFTWTGAVSNAWNDPGNWTSCGVPDTTRDIIIPDVSPNFFPEINSIVTCKSLSIEEGAVLHLSENGVLLLGD